ncbi:hypothetical protein ACSQ67_000586 [Phaseolus vulgaris]
MSCLLVSSSPLSPLCRFILLLLPPRLTSRRTSRCSSRGPPLRKRVCCCVMAGKGVGSMVKAVAEYQYPWREKLVKYKDELAKGVWGYWDLGAWKPLSISARRRARLRKEVLLAGQDWPYDPERKEMKTRRKGHKCDRISAEKRENTKKLMEKMPQMLLDYKKRRWQKKMKEEDKGKL